MAFKSSMVGLAALLSAVGARASKSVIVYTYANDACTGNPTQKTAQPLGTCSNHLGSWVMWHEEGDNVILSRYGDGNCTNFQGNETKAKACVVANRFDITSGIPGTPIYYRNFMNIGCTAPAYRQGTVLSGFCNIDNTASKKITCTSSGWSEETFDSSTDCTGSPTTNTGNGEACVHSMIVSGCPLATGNNGAGNNGGAVANGATGTGVGGVAALLSAMVAALAAAVGNGM